MISQVPRAAVISNGLRREKQRTRVASLMAAKQVDHDESGNHIDVWTLISSITGDKGWGAHCFRQSCAFVTARLYSRYRNQAAIAASGPQASDGCDLGPGCRKLTSVSHGMKTKEWAIPRRQEDTPGERPELGVGPERCVLTGPRPPIVLE
ncbi:hypothetical protein BDV96DRAFT_278596 [Lophiotrema nucula]|uniref:Uncharacterized protein n=1 Tax=Lophiotrema nucula TaxID=690887 RepID=A0A6A5ZMF8_9PLEO|nr:hypothetical protein BDV96DRAFT_278596 [Lophiotrema nucula]